MVSKEAIHTELFKKVEDKAILEELVAINLLPFVEKTTRSCSGHVDLYGLLRKESPSFRIKYISPEKNAQKFHKQLQNIKVTIEGRDYYLRALDSREEYFIAQPFDIHPTMDLLIGPKILEIPSENPEIGYLLIIPNNFEKPINRNITILEDFWSNISCLLSQYFSPEIYQKRDFTHQRNKDGTIESSFRKDKLELLF